MWSAVHKRVKHPDTVSAIVGVPITDLATERDLVLGSLGVVSRTLLDLRINSGGISSGRNESCHSLGLNTYMRSDHACETRTFIAPYFPVSLSTTSHTVEKWPQPSFLRTIYRPTLYFSPMNTGWYPPFLYPELPCPCVYPVKKSVNATHQCRIA